MSKLPVILQRIDQGDLRAANEFPLLVSEALRELARRQPSLTTRAGISTW